MVRNLSPQAAKVERNERGQVGMSGDAFTRTDGRASFYLDGSHTVA